MADSVFREGDAVWVQYWKQRIHEPVLAEVRFDIINIHSIDISKGSYKAKVLIYVRVPVSALGMVLADRVQQAGDKCHVVSEGRKIMEWTPWPELTGNLEYKWSWVRADTRGTPRGDCLVHALEVDGAFRLGEEGSWFPFDFHELRLQLSSNWDETKIVFMPWGDEAVAWDMDTAMMPLEGLSGGKGTCIVDKRTARMRTEEVRVTLRNKWSWAPVPMLEFGVNQGFNRYRYAQVQCTVLVQRRVLVHAAYEFLRPLTLALISPLSLYFFADEAGRLEYNVGILVAMSLAFLRGDAERVSYSDYYKLSMFIFAALSTIFTTFPEFFPDLSRGSIKVISWVMLVVVHVPFMLGLMYQVPRRALMRKFYSDGKANQIEAVTSRMKRGGGAGGAVSVRVDDDK